MKYTLIALINYPEIYFLMEIIHQIAKKNILQKILERKLCIFMFLYHSNNLVKTLMKKYYPSLLFIIILVSVSFYYNYHKIVFKHFNKPVWYILSILAVFTIIGLWLIYAHNYNRENECTYFSTTIFPIRDLDKAGIYNVVVAN